MNTMLTLHQLPLYINIPSSLNQNNQSLYSKTSWRLHAQAKGFKSGGSKPLQNKEKVPKLGSSQEEEEDDDDKIPQVVFERIIRRILTSVGVPMVFGVVLLKVFDILKAKQIWDVPLWVPFVTTFVFFGSSILGVAYGSLSTSWDPEKQGSLFGFEEAKQNWDEMWKEENNN